MELVYFSYTVNKCSFVCTNSTSQLKLEHSTHLF